MRPALLVLFFVLIFSNSVFAEQLTLASGLRIAVVENRLIKLSLTGESVSEEDVNLALSPFLPDIKASASQTFLAYQPEVYFGRGTAAMSEQNFLSYGISVQQILYDFGGNRSRYEASKLALKGKRLDTKKIRNAVSIDFTNAYFDLLESEKMLAVAEKEVERLSAHKNNAERLFKQGAIIRNDQLQAELKLSDARQRLLTIRNLRLIHMARINNILARPLTTPFDSSDIKDETPMVQISNSADALLFAMQSRPDFGLLDVSIESVNERLTGKKSEYMPRVFVRGGYDYTQNQYQVHEGNWAITLGASISLYSGGGTKSEINKFTKQRLMLEQQKTLLADDVRLQIESGLLNLMTARERLVMAKESISQAEENLRVMQARYDSGSLTSTDVLDAVALLAASESNYYKAIYDMRRAEAGLGYAQGKDLLEVYK